MSGLSPLASNIIGKMSIGLLRISPIYALTFKVICITAIQIYKLKTMLRVDIVFIMILHL